MKTIKNILGLILLLFCLASFSQCSSSKTSVSDHNKTSKMMNIDNKAPLELDSVTYQKWVAGVKDGGSGYHIYINVASNRDNIVMDSIYFRGETAQIRMGKMGYFSYLSMNKSNNSDIIHSSDANAEYANKITRTTFPFNLEENECVISYKFKGETRYFKVSNLIEKPAQHYPSAPKGDN